MAGRSAFPGRPSDFRGLVLISPNFLGESALFPFTNPAFISIPIGFIASYLGTDLSSEGREGYTPYRTIYVRFNVGAEEG